MHILTIQVFYQHSSLINEGGALSLAIPIKSHSNTIVLKNHIGKQYEVGFSRILNLF